MLCPECRKDTLENHRTYESEYLPFRKTVRVCMSCGWRGFYYLSWDKNEEYNYKNDIVYKRAYERLCQILKREAEELEAGENYFEKAFQLSFDLASNELAEKLEGM